MFECGLGLGICEMLLALYDTTVSIPCIGRLIGEPFKETLGTCKGAVESPHLFNLYVRDLRRRLQDVHITIAVLLYADDAALPADSFEDLRLSVESSSSSEMT